MDADSETVIDDPYEEFEPRIDSNNPEERKLARRLRIQRRHEAQSRGERKESVIVTENLLVETPIQGQLRKSNKTLEALLQEGDEYITNVRTANDAREVARRHREGLNKDKIFENLDAEAKEAENAFEEITSKWTQITGYNDPLLINDEIQRQKEKCDMLIRQKDGIIAMLRDEIKTAEINYNNDQHRQMGDISTLTQRIEKQIILIRKAYRQELDIIEDVIMSERKILMDTNDRKWDDLYKQREVLEDAKASSKNEALQKCEKELNDLRKESQEQYRETKIKLENDIEYLQREFEKIKTLALINSEKLDYNYQVLKKREDENLIIKAQQKRKLNKMQDLINKMRRQMREYDRDIGGKISKLKMEVEKLQQNVVEIEKKANHFAAVGDFKFNQIWKLNKNRAESLVKKILTIDRLLYEQHLGIEWKKPELHLCRKEDLVSYQSAIKTIGESVREEQKQKEDMYMGLDQYRNYRENLRRVIRQISEKSDFLIEDKLEVILKPFEETDKKLVKMDHVFEALGLTNKDDISIMMEFFLPYTLCEMCSLKSTSEIVDADVEILSIKSDMEDSKSSGTQESADSVLYFEDSPLKLYDTAMDSGCKGPDEGMTVKEKEKVRKSKVTEVGKEVCFKEHLLFINPTFVLKPLREFMDRYYSKGKGTINIKTRLQMKRTTVTRLISEEDVKTYWLKYLDFFTEEKEKIWDGLLNGLKKYHVLLKERKKLSEEVVGLRKQNKELRQLLLSYVDSY